MYHRWTVIITSNMGYFITVSVHCGYLRQGGYVFASVSLFVCLFFFFCLCVINITQKVTDQFLRKFLEGSGAGQGTID